MLATCFDFVPCLLTNTFWVVLMSHFVQETPCSANCRHMHSVRGAIFFWHLFAVVVYVKKQTRAHLRRCARLRWEGTDFHGEAASM